MAVGRMLNRTVGLDQELNAVSLEAQLLFLMSIPHLDRDGLIIGEMLPHLGTVLPLRPDFISRYESILSELLDKGIVIRYPTKKGRVLFFPGFRKNQTFVYSREGKSVFDPPPGYVRTDTGLEIDTTRDLLLSNSGVTQEDYTLKLNQSKSSEVKSSQSGPDDDDLEKAITDFQVLGMFNKTMLDQFNDMWPELSGRRDWIGKAITVARDNNPRSPLQYALKVLANAIHTGQEPGYTNGTGAKRKGNNEYIPEPGRYKGTGMIDGTALFEAEIAAEEATKNGLRN